jgi:rhodanese-related sulfurtransferase
MPNLFSAVRISAPRPLLFRSFFVVFIALSLSACSEPPYTNLDNAGLKAMLEQGVPLYDIRRPDEWRQTGVVEGSKRLTFVDGSGRLMPDFFNRFTASVGKDDPVILICRTGNRTSVLGRHLVEKMGYTKVYNVRDGIVSWIGDRQKTARL